MMNYKNYHGSWKHFRIQRNDKDPEPRAVAEKGVWKSDLEEVILRI